MSRRAVLLFAFFLVILGSSLFSSSASAGQLPTASARGACLFSGSLDPDVPPALIGRAIDVSIVDDFGSTYNIYIDDELRTEATTTESDDGGFRVDLQFSVAENGTYNVRVVWLAEELEILDEDVTVDCSEQEPTTTTTTTPTTTPTTTAGALAAAQPRFTG